MKAVLLISTLVLAVSGNAGVITCSDESSPFTVQVNEDRQAGYVDADNMCIILTCKVDSSLLFCEGEYNNLNYTVFLNDSEAMVARDDGLDYDSVSVLTCKEQN
jgi:hypothetical protein